MDGLTVHLGLRCVQTGLIPFCTERWKMKFIKRMIMEEKEKWTDREKKNWVKATILLNSGFILRKNCKQSFKLCIVSFVKQLFHFQFSEKKIILIFFEIHKIVDSNREKILNNNFNEFIYNFFLLFLP